MSDYDLHEMQRQPAHRRTTSTRRWPVVVAVTAALLVVGGGATAVVWISRSNQAKAADTTARTIVPFNVIATTPGASAKLVPSATTITVSFSAPIAQGSRLPSL